jgi:metal-responsive CopG/Arc/MetJ family transcriptional regulator
MKTAISIEDDLFKQAEEAAKELGLSRSALFSQAVEEFIRTHMPSEITKKYNEVYSETLATDEELNRIAYDVLSKAEW